MLASTPSTDHKPTLALPELVTACAGTANEQARATVEALLREVLHCRKVLAEMKAFVAGFTVDGIVVERMAGVCAMSLAAIMSGMGDLKTFKLLRCALVRRLLRFGHCLVCTCAC